MSVTPVPLKDCLGGCCRQYGAVVDGLGPTGGGNSSLCVSPGPLSVKGASGQ